ncbi:MAG: mandelate racemase/muconate lactonizing enzyme family protein, partial [Myxococcales bacterium]|nr:mandelate racemase/muconate lactonizing enzyme family protein [Myxococcales bacterium]
MSTIARIELFHVRIPYPQTFYPSWIPGFPQRENRFDLLRVTTEDGVEGISANLAMGEERKGLGAFLGPYLIGEDATDIPAIRQRLREISYLGWRNPWIEAAFWDIKGKIEGMPVCRLLGGEPREVKLYASTGEVRSVEARIDDAHARLEEGFESIKLRVHEQDEAKDIQQIVGVAKALGDRMKIGVDANQGWRVSAIAEAPLWDLARAKRFADACADAGIAWLEEPLPMDDYEALASLREYSRVPISGGEMQPGGLVELRTMMERGCYDIIQPDAMLTAGISECLQIAKLARAHGLIYTPHTWTTGIGFAANLHLMAASGFADEKPLEYPYDPPGYVVEARDGILKRPFHHHAGRIQVPSAPGLGIEIDEWALGRYGRRFFVMDKKRLVFFALRDRGLRAALEIDRHRKARRK